MGRLPRPTGDDLIYHAINRGNNRADVLGPDGGGVETGTQLESITSCVPVSTAWCVGRGCWGPATFPRCQKVGGAFRSHALRGHEWASSNYWKTSVINETGRWEHLVGRASRNSGMAA